MNIVNLMDMKKGKRKASLILWAASLALLMQVQPLCAMDQPETREQKLEKARAKKQEMLRKIGEASQPQLEKAPEQKAQVKREVGGGKPKEALNPFEEALKESVADPLERKIGNFWDDADGRYIDRKESYIEKLLRIRAEIGDKIREEAKNTDELQRYVYIVESVMRAEISPEVQSALAKKLLQKIAEKLNSDESKANFTQSLYREIHPFIVREENKFRRVEENKFRREREEYEKKQIGKKGKIGEKGGLTEFETNLQKLVGALLGDPNLLPEEFREASYLNKLYLIIMTTMGTQQRISEDELDKVKQYRYILESVVYAEVSPKVQQALAKKLMQKTLEALTKGESNFVELLEGTMKPIIVREENKYKKEKPKKINVQTQEDLSGFNFQPVRGGQLGYEEMREAYKVISSENKKLLNDPANRQILDYAVKTVKETFDQLIPVKGGKNQTILELKDQDSVDAAKELATQGYQTALVNFANKDHPGGGYTGGALAQEEDICRRTTLYPVLKNMNEAYPINDDELIYSEDIKIFRDSWKNNFSIIEGDLPSISVVTMAAYNLNSKKVKMTAEEYRDGMKEKVRAQLRVAANNGVEAIVLGAFGCGVFGGDPDVVSTLYKEIIESKEFKGVFKVIRFAILGAKSKNYGAFKSTLTDVKVDKITNNIK